MTLVKAIDVSSYQPKDLGSLISHYQPEHVVVHIYHDQEGVTFDWTAAQVASAQANGCTVGGYCFLYPGTDMVRTITSTLDRCNAIGLVLPLLWLDVETYNGQDLTQADIIQAADVAADLETPVGIYTSREMWRRVGNPTGFEEFPAWIADYNGMPDLLVSPVLGLPRVVAHQYRGDPLDLNVFEREYTVVTQPDPCAELRSSLTALAQRKGPVRKGELRALLNG